MLPQRVVIWMVSRWTVDDASLITARFAEWLGTGDANRLTQHYVWNWPWPELSIEPGPERRQAAAASNDALAGAIRDQDPIWCDPAMVDLLAVATAELPPVESVQPWQLPAPTAGLVLFAKPLPAEWRHIPGQAGGITPDYTDEISAVTWERPWPQVPDWWLIRPWGRQQGTGIYNVDGCGKVRCPDLRPTRIIEVMGNDKPAQQRIGKILIALTALAGTASSVAESRLTAPKKARLRARRAGITDPRVRRLYLHHPEHGAAELNALRAERQGAPRGHGMRGHWVRGHWRQQWFPSIQEHRWQWIDGFPRGDFSKGTVNGDRILIAKPGPNDKTD